MTSTHTTGAEAWVTSGTFKAGGERRVIHTDSGCPTLHEGCSVRPATPSETEEFDDCTVCAGGGADKGAESDGLTCPECGTRTQRLGIHIRACDGGSDDE